MKAGVTELFILHRLTTTLQLVLAINTLEDSGGSETWEEAKRCSTDCCAVPAAVSVLTTASLVYANETWSDVNTRSLGSSDQSMGVP